MSGSLISLTTDFGLADSSVAACKGVILGLAPDATLLDISHGITPYAIAEGAAVLWAALPFVPAGVHMAVVDPGVGTDRRPVALRTGRGDFLVGPDNGLLIPAAERLGGVTAAHQLVNPAFRLPEVSRTFHARDVFAPAAAHLSLGVPIEALGPAVAVESLAKLDLPAPRAGAGALDAAVVFIDAFGSAQLLATLADLEAAMGPVVPGDTLVVEGAGPAAATSFNKIELRWRLAYGEAAAGEPLLCTDSAGRLSVAISHGHAARTLGLAPAQLLRIRRR